MVCYHPFSGKNRHRLLINIAPDLRCKNLEPSLSYPASSLLLVTHDPLHLTPYAMV